MFGLAAIIVLLLLTLGYVGHEFLALQRDFNLKIANFKENELKRQMDEYKAKCDAEIEVVKSQTQRHIDEVTKEFANLTVKEAAVQLEKWKTENEESIRKDAIAKSQQVVAGKISEHFIPYLEGWNYNAKDARFLGSPTDFIVFDGLSDGQLKQIVFIEVKTNKAQLTQREKQIRDIINNGQVQWEEVRHMIGEGIKS